MFDPVSLAIAAAISLGSAGLNSMANNQVRKAQRSFTDLENQRQDEFKKDAGASWQQALMGQGAEAQIDRQKLNTERLQKNYVDTIPQRRFTELLPGQGDSSNTVKTAIINEGRAGLADAIGNTSRKAALDAYGTTGTMNDIDVRNAANNIGQISSNAGRSQRILPMELQGAQSKGSGLRTFASLLDAAGGLYGAYTAAGGNLADDLFGPSLNPNAVVIDPSIQWNQLYEHPAWLQGSV